MYAGFDEITRVFAYGDLFYVTDGARGLVILSLHRDGAVRVPLRSGKIVRRLRGFPAHASCAARRRSGLYVALRVREGDNGDRPHAPHVEVTGFKTSNLVAEKGYN